MLPACDDAGSRSATPHGVASLHGVDDVFPGSVCDLVAGVERDCCEADGFDTECHVGELDDVTDRQRRCALAIWAVIGVVTSKHQFSSFGDAVSGDDSLVSAHDRVARGIAASEARAGVGPQGVGDVHGIRVTCHRTHARPSACSAALDLHAVGMTHIPAVAPLDVVDLGKSDEFLLIGLDGEMSAAELCEGGALIQAGLAIRTQQGVDVFCEMINPQMPWSETPSTPGTLWWSESAAAVHGLTKEQIASAKPASEVDELAYQWLIAHGATDNRRQVITVGFNVMAFDHPFFRSALPLTMSLIARRGIDLNAVCFTLAGWDPVATATPRHWTGWKRSLKAAAVKTLEDLGIFGAEHDAGYDAALALAGSEFLRDEIRGCKVVAPAASVSDPVLAAVFSPRAWARIEHLDRAGLRVLAALLVANDIQGSKWLGTRRDDLSGKTPLEVLLAGHDPATLIMTLAAG